MQTCTALDLLAHGLARDGNFPSAVGIYIAMDANGVPTRIQPVFANDAAKYREAVVSILAYKRCMGKSHAEVMAMDKGKDFLKSTLRFDEADKERNEREVQVDFIDVPTISDADDDDKSRQLAYHIKFARGGVRLEAKFTPSDFVMVLLRVRLCWGLRACLVMVHCITSVVVSRITRAASCACGLCIPVHADPTPLAAGSC